MFGICFRTLAVLLVTDFCLTARPNWLTDDEQGDLILFRGSRRETMLDTASGKDKREKWNKTSRIKWTLIYEINFLAAGKTWTAHLSRFKPSLKEKAFEALGFHQSVRGFHCGKEEEEEEEDRYLSQF